MKDIIVKKQVVEEIKLKLPELRVGDHHRGSMCSSNPFNANCLGIGCSECALQEANIHLFVDYINGLK